MFASVVAPVSDFFSWWVSELAGLLRFRSASTEVSASKATVISIDGDQCRILGQDVQSYASLENVPSFALSALADQLTPLSRLRSPPAVALRLPYRACFARTVALPSGAAADYPRLLAIDLERATPFRLSDVYTAYLASGTPNGGKTLLRQFVIKRQLVDGIRAFIEALNLDVTAIQCWNESGTGTLPLNFLLPKSEPRRRLVLVPTLAATAIALSLLAGYLTLSRYEDARAHLQTRIAEYKIKAQQLRESLSKAQAAASTAANFKKLKQEFVSRAEIVEELTQVLPDSAWVTDLKINGATVDISGLATSASTLVPLLEKSPYFVDATSTAPLTFDPRESKERFSIRVRLRSIPETSASAADRPGEVQ